MTDMQQRHMFINSLLPHLKYPLQQKNVSDTGRGSLGSPATIIKPLPTDGSNHQRTEGGFEELNAPTKLE
jgi:hypothetical protein